MELLNRKLCLLIMASLLMLHVQSQTTESMQKAFKQSYTEEYKSDYATAITHLQRVYKEDSYELNLRMGWLFYSDKKYAKSMDYYQKAIDLRKYSIEARLGYIGVANASNLHEKAYAKYEEILKIDPYNSIANYWVGVNYYTIKKYDIAAKYLELVVNMYPFDYDANHMLGWTYLNLGRSAEAKHLFEIALLNKPDNSSAKEGLSKCNK